MKAKPVAPPAPPPKQLPKTDAPEGVFAQLLQQRLPMPEVVEEAAPPAPSAPIERIAALANEIGARVEATPVGTVTIQFDAKTFEGLTVEISRERGQLQVKLVSPTPEVAQLLSSNAENLRQRLEERGYRQAVVQVQRVRKAAAPKEQKPWR